MAFFLLTWNPKTYSFDDLTLWVERAGDDTAPPLAWSCGKTTRRIVAGDVCYFFRQGTEPKGIFGMGTVARPPYTRHHYDPARAARGEMANFVDVQLIDLIDSNFPSHSGEG